MCLKWRVQLDKCLGRFTLRFEGGMDMTDFDLCFDEDRNMFFVVRQPEGHIPFVHKNTLEADQRLGLDGVEGA